MTLSSKDVYRRHARLLKLLAHETRLMIVDRLSRGECTAGELVEMIAADQTTVSKHLALLRAHGIVEDRRDGNSVIYRLLTPCIMSFFGCAASVLKERRGGRRLERGERTAEDKR